MVRIPISASASSALGPTPHRERTGMGARNDASSPGATTTRPSGLPMSEAILATVLLVPTPMDTVSPVSSFTRRLSSRASSSGPSRVAPPMAGSLASRNASSSESGSTRGVTSRKMAITCRETSA